MKQFLIILLVLCGINFSNALSDDYRKFLLNIIVTDTGGIIGPQEKTKDGFLTQIAMPDNYSSLDVSRDMNNFFSELQTNFVIIQPWIENESHIILCVALENNGLKEALYLNYFEDRKMLTLFETEKDDYKYYINPLDVYYYPKHLLKCGIVNYLNSYITVDKEEDDKFVFCFEIPKNMGNEEIMANLDDFFEKYKEAIQVIYPWEEIQKGTLYCAFNCSIGKEKKTVVPVNLFFFNYLDARGIMVELMK